MSCAPIGFTDSDMSKSPPTPLHPPTPPPRSADCSSPPLYVLLLQQVYFTIIWTHPPIHPSTPSTSPERRLRNPFFLFTSLTSINQPETYTACVYYICNTYIYICINIYKCIHRAVFNSSWRSVSQVVAVWPYMYIIW